MGRGSEAMTADPNPAIPNPAIPPIDTDELLDTLVQRALIHFDGSRYAYHALVRQYAYARLGEVAEDVPAIHRLAPNISKPS